MAKPPTTTKKLTVTNIRLTPQTLAALTKLAAADRRSLSQFIRLALERLVAEAKGAG